MNIAAIIPARGGSKRIPGKNIRDFNGRPMISYSIQAAKDSGIFGRIIVSTDSEEIADVAREYGAEVPFMRPAELSGDTACTEPVLIHALDWLESDGFKADLFCCIFATAPFITGEYLRKGLEMMKEKKAHGVFSLGTSPFPIFRALKLEDDGKIAMFWPEYIGARSNEIPEAYMDAGQFYWCDTENFRQEMELFAKNSYPVILPRYMVHDIDSPEDWETAEKIYKALEGDLKKK